MGDNDNEIKDNKKYTSNADDFDCRADAAVRYGAHRPQWSISRASLEATGCHHWASACIALPLQPPWSTNLVENTKH